MRAAITSFFTNASIPYVGTVFPTRQYIHGEDYEINAMGQYVGSVNSSGAVLVVNLPADTRTRKAMSGRGYVVDTDVHPVNLEVFFGCPSGQPQEAQEDYDTIIDALFVSIRGNPTLGNSVAIWSAGEFSAGVKHRQSEPFTLEDGTSVFIYGTVDFEAWEWDIGAAGTV